MRKLRNLAMILMLALFALLVSQTAGAADWTKAPDGAGGTCSGVLPGITCYLDTAGETSSVLQITGCTNWKFMVWENATSVMPEDCRTLACTLNRPLLLAGLTGQFPNTYLTNGRVPVTHFRVVTTDSVSVSLECGPR